MDTIIYAGIVTYNPNIDRLRLNIESIKPQVHGVIVVDNNSANKEDIISLCNAETVQLVLNDENKGIAFALNTLMQIAMEKGAAWCVTLDQDSQCPSNLISTACEIIDCDNIGQIVPCIREHNTKEVPALDTEFNGEAFQEVKKSITSAAITNVDAWSRLGGFDNELFIDYVDYDYALRLRLAGYRIIRMNEVYLDHELGDSEYRHFLFLKVRVANHSAFRRFYICRNIVIYIRRYHKHINVIAEILRLVKTIMLAVLYEKDKRNKLIAAMRGIKEGICFKIK